VRLFLCQAEVRAESALLRDSLARLGVALAATAPTGPAANASAQPTGALTDTAPRDTAPTGTAVITADGQGADGRGADGRGADGRGADGRGADGRGADGRGADGRGADGRGADGRGLASGAVVGVGWRTSQQRLGDRKVTEARAALAFAHREATLQRGILQRHTLEASLAQREKRGGIKSCDRGSIEMDTTGVGEENRVSEERSHLLLRP
jgi:uncharacterized protein YjbI with pentapeptide repeats